jgi:hypothetical protein
VRTDPFGLGLFYGSAVLTALFAVVRIISWRFGGMSKPWYWASIVAAAIIVLFWPHASNVKAAVAR